MFETIACLSHAGSTFQPASACKSAQKFVLFTGSGDRLFARRRQATVSHDRHCSGASRHRSGERSSACVPEASLEPLSGAQAELNEDSARRVVVAEERVRDAWDALTTSTLKSATIAALLIALTMRPSRAEPRGASPPFTILH